MKSFFHWAGAAYVLLEAAQHFGVEKEKVLEKAGIAQADIPPSAGRMPWAALAPIVAAAVELTGEPGIGLAAGGRGTVHLHGVAGAYYMHLSPARVSQQFAYEQIWSRVSNLVRFRHEDVGGQVRHRGEACVAGEPLIEPLVHIYLSTHITAYRGVFGDHAPIDHIAIRSTAAGDAAHLSEIAGCRVLTGREGDWVSVPRELTERTMPLADPWLREQLRPQMEAFIRMLDGEKDATMAVRNALDTAFRTGGPTGLAAIAARLGCKPRTLRGRLAAEGTSFSEILDVERKAFVLNLVTFPGAKLAAVAAQAGFSDPASFTRAFRRWTGAAPSEWQEQGNRLPEAPARPCPGAAC